MTDQKINDGGMWSGPPLQQQGTGDDHRHGVYEGVPGRTLRDWFAGQALAGISANPELQRSSYDEIARWSYEQADAMLKARETPND